MSNLYHTSFYAMGTRCNLVIPDFEEELGEQLTGIIKNEIHRIENSLSRFVPYSEISQINKNASQEPVHVSPEVFEILSTCSKYSRITKGAFDITLRPLYKYWEEHPSDPISETQLNHILNEVGMKHLRLNQEDRSVSFDSRSLELDLGGFGKGYALEEIRTILEDFSIKNAFISFGESSILTKGEHPAGDHWKIGINNYVNPGEPVHAFEIRDASVSTSSNFYMSDDGTLVKHRHVINPFTGHPMESCLAVSVCSKAPVFSEILSTALLVAPDETIEALSDRSMPCEIVKVRYDSGEPEISTYIMT
ncbi:FAD:protein FMN transferase [Balneolaceae bacterium ANBcel3]|nr:FAD:protein FMN transferase [Balneolaceae bacterium ANBcel3]